MSWASTRAFLDSNKIQLRSLKGSGHNVSLVQQRTLYLTNPWARSHQFHLCCNPVTNFIFIAKIRIHSSCKNRNWSLNQFRTRAIQSNRFNKNWTRISLFWIGQNQSNVYINFYVQCIYIILSITNIHKKVIDINLTTLNPQYN